jgi:hypothetical protein
MKVSRMPYAPSGSNRNKPNQPNHQKKDISIRRLRRMPLLYSDRRRRGRFPETCRFGSLSCFGRRNLLASLAARSASLWLRFLWQDAASSINFLHNYSSLFTFPYFKASPGIRDGSNRTFKSILLLSCWKWCGSMCYTLNRGLVE